MYLPSSPEGSRTCQVKISREQICKHVGAGCPYDCGGLVKVCRIKAGKDETVFHSNVVCFIGSSLNNDSRILELHHRIV